MSNFEKHEHEELPEDDSFENEQTAQEPKKDFAELERLLDELKVPATGLLNRLSGYEPPRNPMESSGANIERSRVMENTSVTPEIIEKANQYIANQVEKMRQSGLDDWADKFKDKRLSLDEDGTIKIVDINDI